MENESTPVYGALIERGKVTAIDSATAKYTVQSLDRDGIVTPPLSFVHPNVDEIRLCQGNATLSAWTRSEDSSIPVVGDLVFFFMFNDGSGRIIGKME